MTKTSKNSIRSSSLKACVMVFVKTSFTLKNSLSELDSLAEKVEEFCEPLGVSMKTIFQAKLAMEEIFVNIVSYGYDDENEHLIGITLSFEDGVLILRIEDDATPFNPLDAEAPDLKCTVEDSKVGGLGLHLTKSVMNEMQYSRCENKNILTLKKNLDATAC